MRLKYLLMRLSTTLDRFINSSFNPFYINTKYEADISLIVKELNIHENKILKDHRECVEINRVIKNHSLDNNQELKDDIIKYLSSSEKWSHLDGDIEYIRIESKKYNKEAYELGNKILFTIKEKDRLGIILNEDIIDFIFRSYLYTFCKALSEITYANVYYREDGKLLPLSHFFNKLLIDLKKENKHLLNQALNLSTETFFKKYNSLYPDYVIKHILTKSNFKII